MKKYVLLVILIIMAAISMVLPVSQVFAAYPVTMTVGTDTGNRDATIIIPITVDNAQLLAGAAFTLVYSDALTIDVDSDFFDTFYNQFYPPQIDTIGTPSPDGGEFGTSVFPVLDDLGAPTGDEINIPVVVDSDSYYHPLFTNPTDIGLLISAARCLPPAGTDSATIFTLNVLLNAGMPGGDYSIIIIPTELDNADAGYDPLGEEIELLVGSDLTKTIDSGEAFPVIFPVADWYVGTGSNTVSGLATFTDADGDSDGMGDGWEAYHFGTTDNDGTADTDFDGYSDFYEHENVTAPNNYPDSQDVAGGVGYNACTDDRIETQQVSLTGPDYAYATSNITVSVNYDVSDNDNMLDGISLYVYFDSSKVDYTGYADFLEPGDIYPLIVSDDSGDGDENADTDKMILMSWTGSADWPGTALPQLLTNLNFHVNNTVNSGDVLPFNVTCNQTSAGYSFCGTGCQSTVSELSLDIDGDGNADALTDGILIIRYLLNFQAGGATWIDGAVAGAAVRTTAAEIEAYIAIALAMLDIDGDGNADALTDGILIIRYLLNFQAGGATWIDGAVAAGATRTTAAEIEAYIASCIH